MKRERKEKGNVRGDESARHPKNRISGLRKPASPVRREAGYGARWPGRECHQLVWVVRVHVLRFSDLPYPKPFQGIDRVVSDNPGNGSRDFIICHLRGDEIIKAFRASGILRCAGAAGSEDKNQRKKESGTRGQGSIHADGCA